MNVLCVTGNLGKDAEIRVTPAGKSVVAFSVAMKSGWGDRATTTWLNCSMWGERGVKVAPYLLKGGQVAVSGEVSLREWESGDKSGTSLELNVNDVTLLGGKPAQSDADRQANPPAQNQNAQRGQAQAPAGGTFDDDIPFNNHELRTWA
jgi:single-strand DNA-binding protein